MVDDAMFKGMQTPFAYPVNRKHVERTPFAAKFSPTKKSDKKAEKVLIGPGSYDTQAAYKNT